MTITDYEAVTRRVRFSFFVISVLLVQIFMVKNLITIILLDGFTMAILIDLIVLIDNANNSEHLIFNSITIRRNSKLSKWQICKSGIVDIELILTENDGFHLLITKCVNMDDFIFTTCDALWTIPPKTHLRTFLQGPKLYSSLCNLKAHFPYRPLVVSIDTFDRVHH